MKSTIVIEDMKDGSVAVTAHTEEGGRRTSSRLMFELILEATSKKFHPIRTHFVPIRKERVKR